MGEKSYQFIYFYYKDGKRIPILTGASRDLNSVLFTPQIKSMLKDFSIKNGLFVWVDGTEFLVDP